MEFITVANDRILVSMTNKIALVTGISKNIGMAIARRLVSVGYFVHGTYNSNENDAQTLKDELKELEIYKVDLSIRSQTLQFIEKVKDVRFDLVVNNAGVIIFEKYDELDLANWDKVMEVNLSAPFVITHGLRESIAQGGVVVNICSTDGMTGSFASMSYSASKAGLINLTKSQGNVFGKRSIRVVGIAPGWVGSGMDSPAIAEAMANNPMGRNATADEIANTVLFMASSSASFINGTTITVDGGYTNVDSILKKESEAI